MNKSAFTIGILLILMSLPAFAGSVNKSVKIDAGAEARGASSVNGSITIGEQANVTGDVDTVNGSIRVERGAIVRDVVTVNGGLKLATGVRSQNLNTVNGSIVVADSVTIDGEIEAVNGRISVGKASTVADGVRNANGRIDLVGATVGGNVSTVSGDVYVVEAAVIKGDLIVEKSRSWGWNKSKKDKPKIVIGPGATIVGTIELHREVELFISDTAEVGSVSGIMGMEQAVRFSGERP